MAFSSPTLRHIEDSFRQLFSCQTPHYLGDIPTAMIRSLFEETITFPSSPPLPRLPLPYSTHMRLSIKRGRERMNPTLITGTLITLDMDSNRVRRNPITERAPNLLLTAYEHEKTTNIRQRPVANDRNNPEVCLW